MKFLRGLILLLPVFLLVCLSVWAADFPQPVGFVNDFAGLFSAGYRQQLEQDLQNFENETSAELAVVTIDSLENNSLEDYAVRLFEQWQIGKKEKDNGLLILIAKQERKIRIEVGYGLEPIINDSRAGRIIREQISPAFKKDDYEAGVSAAVAQIKDYIRSGELASDEPASSTGGKAAGPPFWLVASLLIFLSSFWGRTKRIWPGGVVGAAMGLFFGFISKAIFWTVLYTLIFGLIGLLLDFIFSRNYQRLKKMGKPTDFWSSRGGFFSGGSGRSSGGGGFGGFGGGSSGGGGASGGW